MNRAGTTTHLASSGRMGAHYTACGQHVTHLHAGQAFRSKQRRIPLAIAEIGSSPDCRRCRAHFVKAAPDLLPKFDRLAHARDLAKRPGSHWRFQTEATLAIESRVGARATGRFDEVVVDDWLHAEMMDRRSCFVSVAGLSIWLRIGKNGAEISEIEISGDGKAAELIADALKRRNPNG